MFVNQSKLTVDKKKLQEVFELSENFDFQKTMNSALSCYLRYLKLKQKGLSVIGVASKIDENGKIVPDDKFLEDYRIF